MTRKTAFASQKSNMQLVLLPDSSLHINCDNFHGSRGSK